MPAGKNPEPRKRIIKTEDFSYKVEKYIYLEMPLRTSSKSFFKVLEKRSSERNFAPLSIIQISTLLWYSAKVKKIKLLQDGTILSHRSSPSAGGIHPIDVFISMPNTIAKRDLYYYEPYTHKLAKLSVSISRLNGFFKSINDCIPLANATLIWFASHPARTKSKYKNWDSLVWRDAGALIMTFQLVAKALGINSCPVGTLGEPFFSQTFDSNLISAGGLLLG